MPIDIQTTHQSLSEAKA